MAKKKFFSIGSSLSDGLEQTIAAAHNYSSDLRVDIIALKKIELDPENPRSLLISMADIETGLDSNDPDYERKLIEKESLETLAYSIKEHGIINPVIVYEYNNKYRLIAGERRTLASILVGKTDIQAKILNEKPNELRIRILQWIENIERSDLSLSERMDNLGKILSAFAKEKNITLDKIRVTDISQLIGCTKPHAINLKAVINADSEVKNLIAGNKIRNLEKAAVLTSIISPDLRRKAIADCVNGATLKKLKEYLVLDKKQENSVLQVVKDSTHTHINLGHLVNLNVARKIFDTLIINLDVSPVELDVASYNLNNPHSLSRAFKQLILHLEKVYD
jgi:ParB family transcriptional regulator, chromosome partitioning protein